MSLLEDALTELRKFEGEMKIKSTAMSQVRMDVSSTTSLLTLKGVYVINITSTIYWL